MNSARQHVDEDLHRGKRSRTSASTHADQNSVTWDEVELPQQHLWAAIPRFFRCTSAPVLTFKNLGEPSLMSEIHKRFEPCASDVNIITYPKAGTSWIQEIAWLVTHSADVEAACETPSGQRTTYIELAVPGLDKLAKLTAAQPPRHVKWHHAAWLLPPSVLHTGRIIYLIRNPKDTVVSWYHFQRMNALYAFKGDFDQFFDLFLDHNVPYGSYWENVHSWWALRHQPNVLIMTYEDLHRDLSAQVRKVSDFLEAGLSDAQVATVVEHTSFNKMRANPMTNAATMPKIEGEGVFMRKGMVGDWKNYLSEKQNARMDSWVVEHLKGEDIPITYEL